MNLVSVPCFVTTFPRTELKLHTGQRDVMHADLTKLRGWSRDDLEALVIILLLISGDLN